MAISTSADLLEDALALHRRGAIAEATARYGDVLRADPGNADAYYYLGMLSCQRGRFAEGAELARKALSNDPRHARAHVLLGGALAAVGQRQDALASYERAIALAPELARAHGNRADILSEFGRFAEAIDSYDRAVALQPDSVEDWFNRGVALAAAGRNDDAMSSFDRAIAGKRDFVQAHLCRAKLLMDLRRYNEALEGVDNALAVNPGLAEAWVGRGNILAELKRYEEALAACDRALAANPAVAETWLDRGNMLYELNRLDDAIASYKRAIGLRPDLAQAWVRLGDSYSKCKQHDEAFAAYEKALGAAPDLAEAWLGCGNVCYARNRFDESFAAYERALALKPELAEAWLGRGNVCFERKRFDEALAAQDKALMLQPRLAEAWYGRGATLFETIHIADAIAAFDKALSIKPDFSSAISQRIFTLDFAQDYGFEEHHQARDHWWREVGSAIAERSHPNHVNTRDPNRRIKIGYVSADFRRHSASLAFKQVLFSHDKTQFEIFGYSSTLLEDSLTEQFRRAADQWRNAAQLSDEALCAQIKADEIDILVDLSGHSLGHRLGAFARKPAPVQVTAWGHATGTGLPTIDYLFADPVVCPPAVRHLFAEKIFDLPCIISIDPLLDQARQSEPPALAKGHVTFGVFNRVSKISDDAVSVWAKILDSVPRSQILMKHTAFDDPAMRNRLLKMFEVRGIAADRLAFLGSTSHQEHLGAFSSVDISLDTFPCNGGISTWESLQMGVPVVGKLGNNISSRVGGAIASSIGLSHWIADSAEGYAAIAEKFASRPDHLKTLRRELPSMISASAAGNSVTYTRAVESAYRTMWTNYCRTAR
jgi:predicted O-linked N-acetylglucosamine transferase (SPINDLY family)